MYVMETAQGEKESDMFFILMCLRLSMSGMDIGYTPSEKNHRSSLLHLYERYGYRIYPNET